MSTTTTTHDHCVQKYGGWARLCDPEFTVPEEIFVELDAIGLTRKQFEDIRNREAMPPRDRIVIDTVENLVRAWSRYLVGIDRKSEHVQLDSFADFPDCHFWIEHHPLMRAYKIDHDEIDSFIKRCMEQKISSGSEYGQKRVDYIAKLARLCRDYPPPDAGPDPHTCPVPLRPHAPVLSAAVAMPEPDDMEEAS